MRKNIVLLSDGTGNSAAAIWRTNVWRLFKALDLSEADQIAFYDDGIGTSAFKPLALLGGAFGLGLNRNVLRLYEFLSRNYKPGDRIFCFGFSRGAFTIRVLTEFVTSLGLIDSKDSSGAEKSDFDLHREAKILYRRLGRSRPFQINLSLVWLYKSLRDFIVKVISALFKLTPPNHVQAAHHPTIRFLGLWDTVAAYGLPVYEMTRAIDLYFWPISMRDRNLSNRVERACHALALDDERTTFHPLLWNELEEPHVFGGSESQNIGYIDQERISQVWFAGMHANVGGGYPDDAMAHLPLDWIASQAEKSGLRFKPQARGEFRLGGDPTGRLYNSRSGLAGYYRYGPRRLDYLNNESFSWKTNTANKVVVNIPKIHESVFQRIQLGVGAPHSGVGCYTPFVLPETYAVVRQDGSIESGPSNSFQTAVQDKSRAWQQEKAWDWVWWRRVVYFLTMLTSVYIAATPVWTDIAGFFDRCPWVGSLLAATLGNLVGVLGSAWQSVSTFISETVLEKHLIPGLARGFEYVAMAVVPPVLDLASAVLPSAASRWVDYYRTLHPVWFGAWAGVLGFWIWVGSIIQRKINTVMQGIWSETCDHCHCKTVDCVQEPKNFLYRVRTSDSYRSFIRLMKHYVIPTLFAVLFLFIGLTAFCVLWQAIQGI